MSPRSEEFIAEARDRLAAARRELEARDASTAASLAYYSMLYAARAALSEEGLYAKTHSGSWDLFWRTFAVEGRFDQALAGRARAVQQVRELADYEAQRPSDSDARAVVALAEEFLAAIGDLLG